MAEVHVFGRVTNDLQLKMSHRQVPYVSFGLVEWIGRRDTGHRQYFEVWAWGTAALSLQALRCRCIYRSKPQDCRRFSVPLRRAAPPEQSRLPALRRGLYAAQAEARRTQSPAHGRISSFRARGNLFLCISGVNALHGLTDTIRALGVREVVEAIGLDQMTNPNVRKAVLAMRKEVQKISAFAIQSTHGKPPAREWTIPS